MSLPGAPFGDSRCAPRGPLLPALGHPWPRKNHAPHTKRYEERLYTLRTVVATSRSVYLCLARLRGGEPQDALGVAAGDLRPVRRAEGQRVKQPATGLVRAERVVHAEQHAVHPEHLDRAHHRRQAEHARCRYPEVAQEVLRRGQCEPGQPVQDAVDAVQHERDHLAAVPDDHPQPRVPVEDPRGHHPQRVQPGLGMPAPGSGRQSAGQRLRQPAEQDLAQLRRRRRRMQVERDVQLLKPGEQRLEPRIVEERAVRAQRAVDQRADEAEAADRALKLVRGREWVAGRRRRDPGEPARMAGDRGGELIVRAPRGLDGPGPAELLRGRGNVRDHLHVDPRRVHVSEPALAEVKQHLTHARVPGLAPGGRRRPRELRRQEVLLERYGPHAPIVTPRRYPGNRRAAITPMSCAPACSCHVLAGHAALRRLRSAATIACRSSASELVSTASGAAFAISLRRAYSSNASRLPASSSSTRWSTLSSHSNRCTSTGRTWPIRCARAIACSSLAGVSCGSAMIITDAAWMFRPTPPAWIWETSTAGPLAFVSSSTIAWRSAGGMPPVSGPMTGTPGTPSRPLRASIAVSSTSRKYENTMTFRPPSAASLTISTSRRSFGDPFTVPGSNAARRIAMRFPSMTAFRYARSAAPSSTTHSWVSSRAGNSRSTSS